MEDYYLSEPLLGEDRIPYHHHHDRRGRRGSFLVLSSVLAAVVVVLGFCFATVWVVSFPEATLQIQQQQQQQQQHHSHSQPTLLSVVDPETKTLLIVSAHPFYETWKNSLVRTHDPHGLQELKVDKTQLLKVRDSLTVSWQEIDNVRDDDVLALYCGEHEHFLEAATIAQVRATCHFHSRGGDNCNSRWYIPNFPVTREPSCQFVLYQQNNIPVASSPLIELHRLRDAPTNVHLALGDDPTKMVIHFTTGGSATTPGGTPICMYGKSNPTTKVEGTSDTYEASDMCGAPANVTDTGKFISPGMIHTVELTNLEPNTHYTYKVGVPFGQG